MTVYGSGLLGPEKFCEGNCPLYTGATAHGASPVPPVQLEAEHRARYSTKEELGVLCGTTDTHKREAEEKKKTYSFNIISLSAERHWKGKL